MKKTKDSFKEAPCVSEKDKEQGYTLFPTKTPFQEALDRPILRMFGEERGGFLGRPRGEER